MPLEIHLKPEEISEDDLFNVFKLFCQAYGIRMTARSGQIVRESLDDLRSPSGLDYRPYSGAKFFGQYSSNGTQFYGYSHPEDPADELKDEEFHKLGLAYFKSLKNN